MTSIASGAEWVSTPYARLQYGYDDNPRLTLLDHETATIIKTTAGFKSRVREPNWDAGIRGQYSDIDYSPEDELDTDDALLQLNSSYNTELSAWSFKGSVREGSVLVSEVSGVDAGLVQFQKQRTNSDISPSVTWSLTERIQLNWNFQYSEVNYDNSIDAGNLFDYTNNANTIYLSYATTETGQLFAQISRSGFKSERIETDDLAIDEWRGTESVTTNYLLGISGSIGETTSGTLSGGVRRTVSDTTVYTCTVFFGQICFDAANVVSSDQGTGPIYNANLQGKLASGNISLDFGQTVNPSSGGTEVVRDTLSLQFEHFFTRKWKSDLSVNYLESHTIGKDLNGNDREIVSMQSEITWHQNPDWTGWAGTFSYRYTLLDRVVEIDAVARNAVYITMKYN